jgi:hypothetical protein
MTESSPQCGKHPPAHRRSGISRTHRYQENPLPNPKPKLPPPKRRGRSGRNRSYTALLASHQRFDKALLSPRSNAFFSFL